MTEKLPKPMLDALRSGVAPGDHLSADLLAAFVERSLGEVEAQQVVEHLARCFECREVVFLTSSAAESDAPTGEELAQEDRPLSADWPAAAAAPAMPPGGPGQVPLPWWRASWGRAAAIAAVFVVGAGVVVYQRTGGRAGRVEIASAPIQQGERQVPMEAERAPAPRVQPEAGVPNTSVPATAAKGREKAAMPRGAPVESGPSTGRDSVLVSKAAAPTAPSTTERQSDREATKVSPSNVEVAVGGAMQTAPAAPRANGFVQPSGAAEQSFGTAGSNGLSAQAAAINLMQALHPGWRVTAQGHLEHRTSQGWSQVLAGESGRFRVVAAVGGDVWAGGNGGMLYRSTDGGESWKKVALSAPGSAETGAIVAIRFEDAERGAVTTDGGTSYGTTDGGASWTKQ